MPVHDAGVENKIQVVKGPFNILQLSQDKRGQFSSPGRPASVGTSTQSSFESKKKNKKKPNDSVLPDTTVTVSIAAVPNYQSIKTEGPGHSFSVSIPSSCAETDGHVGVFDRQLAHNGVQYSPSTQSRTPPDSTFPESFKDSSQEVRVWALATAPLFPSPLLTPGSHPSDKREFT